MSDSNQIQLSASSRGITDHFFCFTCDQYVWDCDHLIEERLIATRIYGLEGSRLQSFAYNGKSRVLEIEFRVTAPFMHSEIPQPPPAKVIHYFSVPRYVFTRLTRCEKARMQERYWEDHIRTHYRCQTVRTTIILFGQGPVEIKYVNPSDDPRLAKTPCDREGATPAAL